MCGASKCSADGYTPPYSEHVCTSLTVLCTHAYVAAIRSNQPYARTAPGPLTAVSFAARLRPLLLVQRRTVWRPDGGQLNRSEIYIVNIYSKVENGQLCLSASGRCIGGVQVQLHTFLTSALDGHQWSTLLPRLFTLGGWGVGRTRHPLSRRQEDTTDGLDFLSGEKSLKALRI